MNKTSLGDVCRKASSNVAQKDLLDNNGKYPIYGAGGLIKHVDFYQQEADYIAIVKDGAGIGRAMLLPAYSSVIGTMQYILPNEKIDIKYLYYAIVHMNLAKYFSGATIPHIYFKDYQKETLNLPEITEQRKIACIFEKIDRVIDCHKLQLAKLEQLVKSRFIEMFGMPVSNTKRWNTEKMRDVAPSVNYVGKFDSNVWLLNLDMVEAQTGRVIDYLIVPKSEVGNSTCTFDTSNVLYSKLRPYLNKVVVPDRCGYATSELIPLKPVSSKINREYLAFMLRSDEFVTMINEKVVGAKMPRVSMSDFREFSVPIPPMEHQNQFAAFVKQTDKSKSAIRASLEKLEILKKSLMQQYFG